MGKMSGTVRVQIRNAAEVQAKANRQQQQRTCVLV
jgi:hypothetical protein